MKALLSILILALATRAVAQSTINLVEKFAEGANTGWIAFRPEQPADAGTVSSPQKHLGTP